ncbi:MAG: type I secretion C-terminal target domain-containing protein [Prosthecobacter sp.]|jgi:hypothetical protein|uniref:Calx-beta domain-containing protein n=1 Tax=Prosthecobacter sp. TaxID=1965333 RepID=UPI0019F6053A|nr:Calx-beta domain-containing protein [Prosthecobacter sp.]MBE2284565.1 type I secretion C-terminal target domain-containing protein [Prosthecobacter sp.]
MKLICFILALLAAPAFAFLSETDTTFYGKVIHRGAGEPYLLTSGTLIWKVTPASGGAPFIARSDLAPLKNGEFSYQIRLPQRIAIGSLSVTSELDGLLIQNDNASRFQNVEITIDGHAAVLVDPAKTSFDAIAPQRGLFRRADLLVDFPLPDSDYDGMADWWEIKYGLDKLLDDAALDPDGDGITNIAEYRAGSDPNHANVIPRVGALAVLTVPNGGGAAFLATVADSDSNPGQIAWTLGSLPAGISARVVGLQKDGRALTPGGTFTQADVDAGRVIFMHDGTTSVATDAAITLGMRDENVEHSTSVELPLSVANLADLLAVWSLPAPAFGEPTRVAHDASRGTGSVLRSPSGPSTAVEALPSNAYPGFVNSFGADLPRLLVGSPQDDTLLGSGEADWIAGGAGNDTLRGYAGVDRFIINAGGGTDTIVDFQGDVLDLSRVLVPVPGKFLTDYLTVATDTGDTVIAVDANADQAGGPDATVRIKGQVLTQDSIEDLWDAGQITSGAIVPRTTLFITASDAAEENRTPGKFVLRRRGDASTALVLTVGITGTASAGVDYVAIPATVTFTAGQKLVELPIIPLEDDLKEAVETVQMTLPSAPGYVLGGVTASASLTDLPVRVWLEVAERTAYKDSLSPAQILVHRSGALASTLTVGLTATGRATPAVDYKRLPATVTFNGGQETIALDVLPLATASLSRGAEEVIVALKADPAFLFGAKSQVITMIVSQPKILAAWRAAQPSGPDSGLDDEDFDSSDADGDGIKGLMEFALNLNATKADASPAKLVFDANGKPGLEYRRWPGSPEVDYGVEWSTDLKTWHPASDTNSTETANEVETSGLERTVRTLNTPPASGMVFMRLRVQRR